MVVVGVGGDGSVDDDCFCSIAGITLFSSEGWLCVRVCVRARSNALRERIVHFSVNPSRYLQTVSLSLSVSLYLLFVSRLVRTRAWTPITADYIHSIRLLLFPAYNFPCFNFPLVCFTLWEFCHCYFTRAILRYSIALSIHFAWRWHTISSCHKMQFILWLWRRYLRPSLVRSFVRSVSTWVARIIFVRKKNLLAIAFRSQIQRSCTHFLFRSIIRKSKLCKIILTKDETIIDIDGNDVKVFRIGTHFKCTCSRQTANTAHAPWHLFETITCHDSANAIRSFSFICIREIFNFWEIPSIANRPNYTPSESESLTAAASRYPVIGAWEIIINISIFYFGDAQTQKIIDLTIAPCQNQNSTRPISLSQH